MKPIEAARRLEAIALHLAQVLPPSDRWLPAALLRRVREPGTSLDRLLGLRSRAGGRGGYVGCPIPERDRLIRVLAHGMTGTAKDKARRIEELSRRADPAVSHITRLAPIPGRRQLQRILSEDT